TLQQQGLQLRRHVRHEHLFHSRKAAPIRGGPDGKRNLDRPLLSVPTLQPLPLHLSAHVGSVDDAHSPDAHRATRHYLDVVPSPSTAAPLTSRTLPVRPTEPA